jgi:hypothetical protein
MKRMALIWIVSMSFVLVAAAQQKKGIIPEGGGVDETGSTRILYWDQDAESSAGQLAIYFGRPLWKKDYEDAEKFDALTKGKVWRLGRDAWTTLDTQLPLKVSGRNVAPGSFYLGLHRSMDGSDWNLAFFDPAKIRAARVDAFEIHKAKPDFLVPVRLERTPQVTEKLTLTLSTDPKNMRSATLRIVWGNFLLTAPIEVGLP